MTSKRCITECCVMIQIGLGSRCNDTSRIGKGAVMHEVLADDELLARYAASDPAGASAFVRRFERRVFGLAYTIVGDPPTAEEVAQSALLRAWTHAERFDARRGSVLTWLL